MIINMYIIYQSDLSMMMIMVVVMMTVIMMMVIRMGMMMMMMMMDIIGWRGGLLPQEGLGPSLVNDWGGQPSENYHSLTFPLRDAIDGEDYSRFQRDAINNAGIDLTLTEYLRMTRGFFQVWSMAGRPAVKNYHSLTFCCYPPTAKTILGSINSFKELDILERQKVFWVWSMASAVSL